MQSMHSYWPIKLTIKLELKIDLKIKPKLELKIEIEIKIELKIIMNRGVLGRAVVSALMRFVIAVWCGTRYLF